MTDQLINEVRTAYADAGKQRENDAYTHQMRCLSFLTSGWFTPEEAIDAVEYIGEYNAFDPESVAGFLTDIKEADPDALVAIGREGSPVLYVETDNAQAVVKAFGADELADGFMPTTGSGTPDELSVVQTVGGARKDIYGGEDGFDPHGSCAHAESPVPVGEYAEPDPDRDHVRAWWD